MTERRAACVCLFEQLRKIGQTLIAPVERWGEIQVGRLDQGETTVKVGGAVGLLKSASPGKRVDGAVLVSVLQGQR